MVAICAKVSPSQSLRCTTARCSGGMSPRAAEEIDREVVGEPQQVAARLVEVRWEPFPCGEAGEKLLEEVAGVGRMSGVVEEESEQRRRVVIVDPGEVAGRGHGNKTPVGAFYVQEKPACRWAGALPAARGFQPRSFVKSAVRAGCVWSAGGTPHHFLGLRELPANNFSQKRRVRA